MAALSKIGRFRSGTLELFNSSSHKSQLSIHLLGAGDLMNEREYLVKAQEAEVFANAAASPEERHRWEEIAGEYRKLAGVMTELRRRGLMNDPSQAS